MEAGFELVAILVAVGFIAGLIDTIAGGGGLLTVPALLLAGLDPVAALATNKLQSSFGSGSAVIAFMRARLIDVRTSLPLVATTFVGAALGALTVKFAPLSVLKAAMPALLVMIAVWVAVSPKLSDKDAMARMGLVGFSCSAAPAIGFYDGIFGPGTGSFFFIAFVALLGYGTVKATAHTKLLNFTSNIAALLVFVFGGKVVWSLGIGMGVGQFLGAQLGARLAIRHGARIIRPLLVIVSIAVALRLLSDPANPVGAIIRSWL